MSLLIFLLSGLSFLSPIQEQFRCVFTSGLIQVEGEPDQSISSTNVFVFNINENNDIMVYWASGKAEQFISRSGLTKGVTHDGISYQSRECIDGNGSLCAIAYYENGLVRLVYQNMTITFFP
jgi:hypothetical protein